MSKMTNITEAKPTYLGFYRVRLKEGSPLHQLIGMHVITAWYVERDGRRFFDLPRPSVGVEAFSLVATTQ